MIQIKPHHVVEFNQKMRDCETCQQLIDLANKQLDWFESMHKNGIEVKICDPTQSMIDGAVMEYEMRVELLFDREVAEARENSDKWLAGLRGSLDHMGRFSRNLLNSIRLHRDLQSALEDRLGVPPGYFDVEDEVV